MRKLVWYKKYKKNKLSKGFFFVIKNRGFFFKKVGFFFFNRKNFFGINFFKIGVFLNSGGHYSSKINKNNFINLINFFNKNKKYKVSVSTKQFSLVKQFHNFFKR